MICIVTVYQDSLWSRDGYVVLKNGHILPGDIRALADGGVQVCREQSSVVFSRSEIKTIRYNTHKPTETKKQSFSRRVDVSQKKAQYPRHHDRYDHLIDRASRHTALDPALIKAVVQAESNFDRYGISHKGARGLMQLMPETARSLGVDDPFDPKQNIFGGSRYLQMMMDEFNNNLTLALSAYNAGPNAVKKYGTMPPYRETRTYVQKVMQYYKQYRSEPGFYGFIDHGGCLHLSNYSKDHRYRRLTEY
ncbi:MAG: transglycosylase SLT domain-containing protein [Elusimicrobia bacterium]|nr:transglycosylase SLT domain-containing protein [Elusimicrobiota bacterium]MBD3412585.1 transglycosylase SLT domain-containing protein [Elusimicrobiota bacterium]